MSHQLLPQAPMFRAIPRFVPITLLVFAGCAGGENTDAGSETGGTMVVVQPEPRSVFPPIVSGTEGAVIIGAIFDRLAEIGPGMETSGDKTFSPRLATRWEWAPDSLSIAFALDPRARWHDGVPLRANDVRFSFAIYTADTLQSEKKSLLANIDSISVRDSLTPVFWFKRRLPSQFFEATYHMYILPAHLLDSIPVGALPSSSFAQAPVGTGRFRFENWERGASFEVIADTGNARGRAKLDRVIWTFTGDFGVATVKLFRGDADFYEGIRPDNFEEVAASPNFRLEPYAALKYEFLSYNLRKRGDSTEAHPLFGDVNVRRALAMAVDRVSLARNVFDTLGNVALSAAPRAMIPDTAALRQIPFDPANARKLLDSLGWVVNPKDGIRERNGVRFSFGIMAAPATQSRPRYADLLQQQFRAVGIEAQAMRLEGNSLRERVLKRDYDTFLTGWQMNPGRLGMAQTWRSDGEQNFGKYRSAVFDQLLDSAMTSLRNDLNVQRWTAVFQRLIDDSPGLWLVESKTPVAIHRRIRTGPLRPDGWQAGIADFTIDPNQRIDRDGIGLRSAR
ncbi:MAG: peptide ABC transporter substrate-binding protein [Gemmatimonas sp.]